MRIELAKLARHSVIYGIGSSLGVAGSFLLIPLYTHTLSTAEYGALELLYRLADVLILIMFMGVRQAYIRFYFDRRDDEEWHRTVTGTTVFFVLLSCAAVTLVFLLLSGWIRQTVLQGSVGQGVFLLVLSWVPFEMLVNVGLTYFQIRLQSITYVAINFLRLVLFIGLNVAFLYWLDYGIVGVFSAQIAVTGTIAAGILVYLVSRRELRLSWPLIRDMVRYGLPYLPATFFMYIISNADRYFLSLFHSLGDVGVYALAAKIGMVGVMLLADPFLKVWSPFLFSNYDRPDGPAMVSRVFTLFALANVVTALMISVLSPVVLPFLTGKDFAPSYPLVPVISLATVFYGMAHLADAGILIAKQTQYKPLIFGAASAVALGANGLLVPSLGIWGAAIASVLAFLSLLAINLRVSSRFYRIPLEVRRLLLIFASAVLTYLLSLYLLRRGHGGILAEGESVLALAVFPLLLWLGGFFTAGERDVIRRLMRGRRRKPADVA